MRTLQIFFTALVIAAIAVATAVAHPEHESAGPTEVKAVGVGKVKLKKTYAKLREQKVIGRIRPGCELGGPNTRSAALKKPLTGSVNFTQTSPRRVNTITITGGATARGVGIGSTLEDIEAEFPNATVDHGSDEVLGVTVVTIPKSDGGKFQFAVDVQTGKVTLIGIPVIAFCE